MAGLIPDTAAEPIAAGLEITAQARLGAYVGVPLELPGGRPYGTLCAVSRHARSELGAVDEELLQASQLAALVGDQLARLEAQEAARSAELAELQAFFAPGAIIIVTQPIVDLRDGSLVGLEALARFPDHPEGPAAMFAVAAALDMGVDLELAAVHAAMDVLPDVPAPLYLSVNVSPATVLDPRLSALLADVAADRVVLELTEHVAVADYAALIDALRELRATGVRVAVDDAGSGFASLAHILSLAPDVIKLDIVLTRGIDADPARRALASALAGFAADLGATLVAEGIETHAELTTLQDLGVAFGQGYHLGRPAALGAHDLTRDRYTGPERRRSRPWWPRPADRHTQ
jgi:EAL domain-containing protein (putative c-di-GMP-specific phosphodiesterase class I)